jgi:drug/metabolite transporter (DMT)-like permease
MTGLFLAVIFAAAFSHLLRYGQHRKQNMLWVGPANYWTATALCLLFWVTGPYPAVSWDNAFPGIVAGAALGSAYYLVNAAIKLAGVGVSQSVVRLSVVIPVSASIVVWNEQPGLTRVIGLLLALSAIPMLAQGHGMVGSERNKWKPLILCACFVTIGVVGVEMKIFSRLISAGEPVFLTLMFLTAAIGTQLVVLAKPNRPRPSDIFLGAALGLTNVISNYGIINALATLPGTVVFPTISAATIILTSAAAAIIWKERYTGMALLGMAVAAVALVLVNV